MFHCDVNINRLRAHPRRKRSITALVENKNILMIKGDTARLSNANMRRPRAPTGGVALAGGSLPAGSVPPYKT